MEYTKTIAQAIALYNHREKIEITKKASNDDLSDDAVFQQHWNLLGMCANSCLRPQFKRYVLDDDNRDILRFLLYYFNNCKKAEDIFPDKGYKCSNNILLCGGVGVGKTLMMQMFGRYLELTNNPRAFNNLSVTQMINYYKLHNHIDRYTFNEEGSNKFEGNPFNICLNDIGLQTHQYFGTDTKVMICEFLYARNDIWQQQGKFAHITTNLTPKELKAYFDDGYGRIIDRFKSYNLIHLKGQSRR